MTTKPAQPTQASRAKAGIIEAMLALRSPTRFLLSCLLASSLLLLSVSGVLAGKAGINIGDHFGEVDQAAQITRDGGWIVVMAQPGDCMDLSQMMADHPNTNFVIRGHHPHTDVMSPEHAKAWAYTLANMNTGGRKVYFYPVNEPFTRGAQEGFSNDPATTAQMVNAYVDTLLSTAPGLDQKVVFLSPMINRTHPNYESNVDLLGGAGFYNKFSGISMNLYDFQGCGGPFCHPNKHLNSGRFLEDKALEGIDAGKQVYAVESGVVNGNVVYIDTQLRTYYEAGYGSPGPFLDSRLAMTATFSYNPHASDWSIYGTQTASFFQGLGGGTAPIPETFDEEAWFADNNIQDKIDAGEIIQCDECGLSPSTPDGAGYCAAVGNYSTTIFPEYEYENTEYYIHPICENEEVCRSGSYEEATVEYKNSLINQGYEAYCANEEVQVLGTTGQNWDLYLSLIASGQQPGSQQTTQSEYVLDATNMKVPLFRDVSGKRWRMTSLEEFFGFRDIYTNKDTESLINSAMIEKLTSQEQRCQLSVQILRETKQFCQREENADTASCYLNTQIPDPAGSVIGNMKRLDALSLFEGQGTTCSELVQRQDTDPLKAAIMNNPLYLERLYRLGFLVTSVRQVAPNSYTGNPDTFFSFFSNNYSSGVGLAYASSMNDVSITAFKIPDVGLGHDYEKLQNEDGSTADLQDTSIYTDPLYNTKLSVLSTKQQQYAATMSAEYKDILRHNSYTEYERPDGSVVTGPRPFGGNDLINCPFTPGCGVPHFDPSTPVDPLFRAIIDLVNTNKGIYGTEDKDEDGKPDVIPGRTYTVEDIADRDKGLYLNCKPEIVEITPEGVTRISDPSTIDESDPYRNLENDLGETNEHIALSLANRLRNGDTSTPISRTNFSPFTSIIKSTNTEKNRYAMINTYVVYPGEYEANEIANAIRSPFVPFEDAEEIDINRLKGCDPYETDCPPLLQPDGSVKPKIQRGFELIGGIFQSSWGSVVFPFRDVTISCPPGEPDCNYKEAGAGVIASNLTNTLMIPGEKLGFWTREIQKSLNTAVSTQRSYLDSCQTLEQFLLGTCGGATSSGSTTTLASSVVPTPTILGNHQCIPVPEGNPYCSISAIQSFTGWDEARARTASIICNVESGGNPNVANTSCLVGGTVDYSIGLFQINLLAHGTPGILFDANGRTNGSPGYDPTAVPCSVANAALLEQNETYYFIPDNNLRKMVELSNDGTNWQPWAAASYCGIN
ncbi:MAG: hypothetical protein H6774_01985 [Pseudomonadales bacterium]|nr:hypothetical protein [Pseudomonadales bacterium]